MRKLNRIYESTRLRMGASVLLFADATFSLVLTAYKYAMGLWWLTGSGNIAVFSDFWYQAVQYHAPRLVSANLDFIIPISLTIILEYYLARKIWPRGEEHGE